MAEEEGFFEDEAEESDDEQEGKRNEVISDDSEEEEEEEDGPDLEDLINDDEEEEEEEVHEKKRLNRKSRKRSVDRLDDEDYDVILENTGISVQKKFKRVQMFDSDDEEEVGVVGDKVVEPHPSDDEDELELSPSLESSQTRQQSKMAEEDEFEDFIVGDDGRPVGHRKTELFAEPALLEAQEIFGVDFKPSDFGLESEGEEEEEEEEEDDIEDESDGEGGVRVKKRKKVSKNRSIYDVYEPSELERSHLTDKDKLIRITDIPERFQTRAIPVQSSEEGELELESDWVYHQAFCSPPISNQPHSQHTQQHRTGSLSNAKSPLAIPKIKETLNFIRNYYFEVPFIATYRREYVEPELDVYDLWKIYYWDEKWMQLQQRKKDLTKLFKKIQDWQFNKVKEEPERALTEDYRTLDTDDILRLEAVQTEEELSDVYCHFMLYYGRDLIAMKNKKDNNENESEIKTTVKQSKRKDYYSLCQEAGLGSLATKFGLTPEQFGENLRDNYQRHETEQHPYEPEEAGQEFIQSSGLFTTVRAVLQGACHMVAMQLSSEPLVRQAVRQVYQTRSVISVTPTKKGKKEIDESHPMFSYKYIKYKPVREIKGDEFLRLFHAESDGLIKTKISIDIEQSYDRRGVASTFLEEIRMLFYRDEFSLLVEKWNAQRAQSVAQALMKVLYPQMEKELRAKLLSEAKEHVLQCCVLKFKGWLNIGNSMTSREDDEPTNESENSHRVMAVAYSDDWSVPSFTCFLNGNGEVLDYLRLTYIHKKVNIASEVEKEQKEEETKKIRQAIDKRKPDVIVVAASSRQALSVVDELKYCLSEVDGITPPMIELLDPNISEIYSKSSRAKEEFPSYPQLLLLAISLGRRVQEPLYEFTSLLSSYDEEYLSLMLHPLQRSLSGEDLKRGLEIELINKVNNIGVDINFSIEHCHAEHMLSYVSGFGPRKSTGLLKILRQENIQLQNRSQIVTQCSIGPQVFINCAGFIKVVPSTFTVSDSAYVEVLDSTRIHPETYEWARKMAFDALEYYDEVGDESNPSAAVEDVMETPEKLKDLDLDAFAEELHRQEYGDKRLTLYDIRDELFAPFKDHRQIFGKMSADEKFTLLTGESHDTLHEGKLVICTVTGIARKRPHQDAIAQANPTMDKMTGYWQCPFCLASNFTDVSRVWSHVDSQECPGTPIGVRTRLENGLNGFIATKNISDSVVHNPEDRVKPGMTINCRILSVNIEKFSVDLTCRTSDLTDKAGKFSTSKDMYYDHDASEADRKKEETATEQKPKERYMKRVIVHPSFMNVSFIEAHNILSKMEQGEAIFRPSSKGSDQLTLTWKVSDTILQHISVKEEGKPNQFSLGKSLIIGNEEYEDLDEIIARYVQPMASNAREILTYKYYNDASGGNRSILEKTLHEEKSKNPRKIPYFLSASKQYPGKFLLSYQPSLKAKFEYVSLKPEGFSYRGQIFTSVNSLINWFKENYRTPIMRHSTSSTTPNMPPSVRSVSSSLRGGYTPYTPGQTTPNL